MKRPRIHEEHEGARRGRDLFIGVHWRSSAVSKAFLSAVLVFGIAVGVQADTVMLADGQPLVGDLQPGATAGELRLARFGETPLTVKREDILAIDFGRVRADPAPITVTLHSGDRLAGAIRFGPGASVTVQRGAGPLPVPLAAVATVRLKRDATLPAPGASDVVLLANGDKIQGKVEAADGGKLVIRSSLGQVPVDLKRVA